MRNLLSIACITTVLSFSVFSAPEQTQTNTLVQNITTQEHKSTSEISTINSEHQKVIDDFKKYLLTIEPSIREEIKNYRVKMRDLNAKKIELYKKLTQEAQNVLKREREFKKKLPWPERKELIKEINPNQQSQVNNTKTSHPTETINMAKPTQNSSLAK